MAKIGSVKRFFNEIFFNIVQFKGPLTQPGMRVVQTIVERREILQNESQRSSSGVT